MKRQWTTSDEPTQYGSVQRPETAEIRLTLASDQLGAALKIEPGSMYVLSADRHLTEAEARQVREVWETSTGSECVITEGIRIHRETT